MSDRVTQCPQCNTSFRVTEAQLQAANGSVRCGSCLCIFDATRHWVEAQRKTTNAAAPTNKPRTPETPTARVASTTSPAAKPSVPTKPAPITASPVPPARVAPPAQPTPTTRPQGTAPAPRAPIAAAMPEIPRTAASRAAPTAAPYTPPPPPIPKSPAATPEPAVDIDDDELLFDDDSPHFRDHEDAGSKANKKPVITAAEDYDDEDFGGAQKDTFLNLDAWDDEPQSLFKELNDLGDEPTGASDETWAKQLLEEIENDALDVGTLADDSADAESVADSKAATGEFDGISDHLIDELLADVPAAEEITDDLDDLLLTAGSYDQTPDHSGRTDEFVFGALTEEDQITMRDSSAHLLRGLEPEPLQFEHRGHRDWQAMALIGGVALGCLLLAIQYFYFNFDRLARGEQRELFATVCGIIGCELPPLTDLRSIRSSNLIVRSHPKIKGALVVDAIVTNSANFDQPYPLLELRFTDMAGNIVASRRFTPKEYLGGELSGSRSMPPRQPIHVSLEIVDPGREAVNYEINFAAERSG